MNRLVFASIYLLPMIYLGFHGWANKNLIDTTQMDRLAKLFFALTVISSIAFYISQSPNTWPAPNPKRWKCTEIPSIGPQ